MAENQIRLASAMLRPVSAEILSISASSRFTPWIPQQTHNVDEVVVLFSMSSTLKMDGQNKEQFILWALPQLRRLLPLDDQSLQEIVSYSYSLTKQAGAEHLKNLLGDSPQALEFISSFNFRREDTVNSKIPEAIEGPPAPKKKQAKHAKTPLHNAGPVRRPENHGELEGGYTKPALGDDYITQAPKSSTVVASGFDSLHKDGGAGLQPPGPKRDPAPTEPRRTALPKQPPSASGSLISDIPKAKSKARKRQANNSSSSLRTKASAGVNDLTSAIAALEMSNNPTLSSERRVCGCNASIHPLFDAVPNCLSCGKIICALEGIQPCSFCNAPILTREQAQVMIRALKEERGQEKMAEHNAIVSRSGSGSPMFGSGSGTPDDSGDEASRVAMKAVAHRDRLLAFQKESAQRTKIHDEAADYEMTITPGMTQWMSPTERAAALKRQRKYLRELDEANKPEWEKKKTVLSMSLKNGKVYSAYETVQRDIPSEDPSEDHATDDAQKLQDMNEVGGPGGADTSHGSSLSRNPLLSAEGLIRPVWKRPEGVADSEKGREDSDRQRAWRRVQDDNEDNERWILDGGTRGFEDGSQQECG